MQESNPDRFQVYVREYRQRKGSPEVEERPLAVCPTFGEARRLRRAHLRPGRECVIRFLGDTGGD